MIQLQPRHRGQILFSDLWRKIEKDTVLLVSFETTGSRTVLHNVPSHVGTPTSDDTDEKKRIFV